MSLKINSNEFCPRAITSRRFTPMENQKCNNTNKAEIVPRFDTVILEHNLKDMESNLCALMDNEKDLANSRLNYLKNINETTHNITNGSSINNQINNGNNQQTNFMRPLTHNHNYENSFNGRSVFDANLNNRSINTCSTPDYSLKRPTTISFLNNNTKFNNDNENYQQNDFNPSSSSMNFNSNNNNNNNDTTINELKVMKLRSRTITFQPTAKNTFNSNKKRNHESIMQQQQIMQQRNFNNDNTLNYQNNHPHHNQQKFNLNTNESSSMQTEMSNSETISNFNQFNTDTNMQIDSMNFENFSSSMPLKDLLSSSSSSIASLSTSSSFNGTMNAADTAFNNQMFQHQPSPPNSSCNTTGGFSNINSPTIMQTTQQSRNQPSTITTRSKNNLFYNNKKSVKTTVPSSKRQILEEEFRKEKYPSNEKLQKLSLKLNMRYDEVQNYFKKRRREEKETNHKFTNLVKLLNNYLEQED